MLHVQTEGTSQPEHFESINGITPAMKNARKRHFNNAHIDHLEVQAVEDDLLQLASVKALLPDMLTVINPACTAQLLMVNQQTCGMHNWNIICADHAATNMFCCAGSCPTKHGH